MRTWCWNISYNPSRSSNIASGSYSWCIALCVTIVAGWPLRPEVAPTYRQIFILPPLGRWVWIYIIVPITGKHTIEATVSEKLIRKWFTLWLNIIKITIGPSHTKCKMADFERLKTELKKTLHKMMLEDTRSWLVKTLLKMKLATWDVYNLAKKQADLRTTNKALDWKTINCALRTKLRDMRLTLNGEKWPE